MRVGETTSVASRIELAFQSASTSTGTSFDYLVKTAARESSFNPTAKARTSSATGLFQFIESTWLETMKEAGSKHGLENYSDHIQKSKSGKFYVKDSQMRREILELRKDPEISSMMAGALTQKNANYLERRIGREPTDGELYMAHFLGANGASRLIESTASNPDMRADKMFSAQARANKAIFYERNGKARSMDEVYQVIVSKHDAVTMIAEASGKKNLRTSGELQNVAALPNAKPANNLPMMNPETFDHLAGDPAAAFAMRAKPAGPVQMAMNEAAPTALPTGSPLDLVRAAAAIPEIRQANPIEPVVATARPVTQEAPVSPEKEPAPALASVARPVPDNPREASIRGVETAAPTSRVLSAFQAAETANPFEALFRNDPKSNDAVVNPRFASAFAAVEEAAMFSALSGASNQVAAQELALVNQGGPLDLTRFLRLKADDEQKDLLPPA
ncbi:MAG: transglycosylase SLT domain-containing protein [Roseibium sp.]